MQKRPFLFAFDRISFETGLRESLVIPSQWTLSILYNSLPLPLLAK